MLHRYEQLQIKYKTQNHIKSEDVYDELAEDVKVRFDASNYQINRLLSIGKNKNVLSLTKHELGGEIKS